MDLMVDIVDLQERATGVHVSKTLPCGDDHIVLLDYDQASRSKLRANLRRVKSDGTVVWAASAPGSNDIFTNVAWRDGLLVAWTWECFMITVDQETGKPVEVLFTK
jgi:outer membrane protein assembly factor BamB